jgi:hypothetical protein
MSWIRHSFRVVTGIFLGGLFGYFATTLLEFLGIPYRENAAAWLAVIGGINGAVVATFGWKYWVVLGNDAADLVGDQQRCNEPSGEKEADFCVLFVLNTEGICPQ